jgi:hypothetical protein
VFWKYQIEKEIIAPRAPATTCWSCVGGSKLRSIQIKPGARDQGPLSDALIGLENVGGEPDLRRGGRACTPPAAPRHSFRGRAAWCATRAVLPTVTRACAAATAFPTARRRCRRPRRCESRTTRCSARRRPAQSGEGGRNAVEAHDDVRRCATSRLTCSQTRASRPPSRPRDGSAAAPSDLAMEGATARGGRPLTANRRGLG